MNPPINKPPPTVTSTEQSPQKPLRGEKPYSFDDLHPTGHDLQITPTIPITIPLKDICVKSNLEINSIIKNSLTLREEDGVGITSGERPLKVKRCTDAQVNGKFSYAGQPLNSQGAFLIFPEIDKLEHFTDDGARFILLVSSHLVVSQLGNQRFGDRFNCIVVSAEGDPDFVIRMAKKFDLPVLAFLDTAPRAFEILAFYGRKLNKIKWLGIRPNDTIMDMVCAPRQLHSLPSISSSFPFHGFTKDDFKTLKILDKDSYIKSRPKWRSELDIMLKMQRKVEVEVLSSIGTIKFVTDLLLPMKLQNEDWI